MNGPSFKALYFCLHRLLSAAVSAALTTGHAALDLVEVGAVFNDRATIVVAVGFSGFMGVTYQHVYNPWDHVDL